VERVDNLSTLIYPNLNLRRKDDPSLFPFILKHGGGSPSFVYLDFDATRRDKPHLFPQFHHMEEGYPSSMPIPIHLEFDAGTTPLQPFSSLILMLRGCTTSP
jgi:hypothetical protein